MRKDYLSTHPATVKPANTSGQGGLAGVHILVAFEERSMAEVLAIRHPATGSKSPFSEETRLELSRRLIDGTYRANAAAPSHSHRHDAPVWGQ